MTPERASVITHKKINTTIKIFELFLQWLKRDISLRYSTSVLGPLWLLLQPLIYILVFTLVFYGFFKIRWPEGDGSALDYGLKVFIGLMLYNFISEILHRSPTLITSHAFLVTKVRFPLPLLGAVTVGSTLLQLLIAILIIIPFIIAKSSVWPEVMLMPLVLLPLAITAVGLSWFLSALGVYLRDLVSIMPVLTSLMMFLSPVFYPSGVVPESTSWLIHLNPLAWAIDMSRSLLLQGHLPSVEQWLIQILGALAIAWLGLLFFNRVSGGFSDVI